MGIESVSFITIQIQDKNLQPEAKKALPTRKRIR